MLKHMGHSATLRNYVGIKMDEGKEYQMGKDYLYLELPLMGKLPENPIIKKGAFVQIKAGCTLSPHKCHLTITPNPAMLEYGMAVGMLIVQADGEVRPIVTFKAEKDVDMSTVSWLCRVEAHE